AEIPDHRFDRPNRHLTAPAPILSAADARETQSDVQVRPMLPYRFPRPVRLALYALAVTILLVLCVLPTRDLPDPGTGDRFEHAAAWFVLTASGYLLAPNRRLAIPAFAVAYGVFIEVL